MAWALSFCAQNTTAELFIIILNKLIRVKDYMCLQKIKAVYTDFYTDGQRERIDITVKKERDWL